MPMTHLAYALTGLGVCSAAASFKTTPAARPKHNHNKHTLFFSTQPITQLLRPLQITALRRRIADACCVLVATFSAFHRRRAAAGVRYSSTTLHSVANIADSTLLALLRRNYLLLHCTRHLVLRFWLSLPVATTAGTALSCCVRIVSRRRFSHPELSALITTSLEGSSFTIHANLRLYTTSWIYTTPSP
jgi:hypothetical protein